METGPAQSVGKGNKAPDVQLDEPYSYVRNRDSESFRSTIDLNTP